MGKTVRSPPIPLPERQSKRKKGVNRWVTVYSVSNKNCLQSENFAPPIATFGNFASESSKYACAANFIHGNEATAYCYLRMKCHSKVANFF